MLDKEQDNSPASSIPDIEDTSTTYDGENDLNIAGGSNQELESKIEDLNDKLLRSIAETENMRRRYEKQVVDAKDYAIVDFAKDLMAVMDNLHRALEHQPKEISLELKNIILGIEMTKDELLNVMQKHGVTSIAPTAGEKFDYNIHHAISQVATDEFAPGTIVNTMQTGYSIKNRLLRPAIVSVAKISES